MKNAVLLTFLILAGTGFLLAQNVPEPGQTLTLSGAIDVALDLNFTVRQAQNNLEQSQAGVLSAYGNFLPNVNLNSSWSGSQGESFLPNGTRLPSTNVRSFSSSISANMTLFDGFSNTSTLSQATSTAVASEHTLSRTRQMVVNQTRRLYYDVLRTEKLLRVAEATLEYSSQQLDRVKETARLGSASLVNVYQQQSQVGQDEVRLAQAQNEYELAKANLIAYLALDVTADYVIGDPSIPEEIDESEFARAREETRNFRQLAQGALATRPDYLSSRESFGAADAGVTIARSGYLPRITAGASYSLSGNSRLVNEFDDFKNNKNLNWSFSVSFPIFSGFRTNEASERALVARKNAEESHRDRERTVLVELQNAILSLQAAEKSYDAAVKSLQYQDQNLKVNQEKYNVGAGTLLDLLFARNNYNSALTTKINAVYQYLNAKSQLQLALGTIQYH
ncbi:MAG: TolC family protein [Ignavibacteriales bacterium]|nr:TolC family protein [Ignavibacteriales bacterium]